MRRWSTFTLGFAVAAALSLATGCGGRTRAKDASPDSGDGAGSAFDDVAYEERIVTAIRESPARVRTAPLQELMSQLGRAGGRAELPRRFDREAGPEEVFEHGAESTVAIVEAPTRCEQCPEWHLGGGATGFIVSADGLCVTNWHVVGAAEGDLWAVTRGGEVHGLVEVVAASEAEDIAILRLDGGRFTPLPLDPTVRVGATVYTVSHPSGRYFTFSEGRVARIAMEAAYLAPANGDDPTSGDGAVGAVTSEATKTAGEGARPVLSGAQRPERAGGGDRGAPEPSPASRVRPMLMITADFGAGSSGGPVFDARGNVVGMIAETETVYADPDAARDPQMVFRLCVPAARILALLDR